MRRLCLPPRRLTGDGSFLFLTKRGRTVNLSIYCLPESATSGVIIMKGREKMLKEKAYEYFIRKDHNCAESVLLAISEEYGLGIGPEEMKLVSAFGGGMGCGKLCGALAGGMAALGKLAVNGRAHTTADFGPLCAGLHEKFRTVLGSTQCEELKAMYRDDEVRCLKTVELALEVFEAYAGEKGLLPAAEERIGGETI